MVYFSSPTWTLFLLLPLFYRGGDAFAPPTSSSSSIFGGKTTLLLQVGRLKQLYQKTSTSSEVETETSSSSPASSSSSSTATAKGMFFASSLQSTPSPRHLHNHQQQERILGSQELLMLPRQYSPNPNVKFPPMNHVSVTVLSETPSVGLLRRAVQDALRTHPLLRARVKGNGEPDKRIDLLKMVRQGEPSPLTFVADDNMDDATSGGLVSKVLTVVNVNGNDRAALDASWQAAFARDLDDGSWCNVETGPLWKLELHQLQPTSSTNNNNMPCALVFSSNHAISDQSSANRLMDQIIRQVAEMEDKGSFAKAAQQKMPMALEDSVLGEQKRWNDVQTKGVSAGTLRYVAGKALEGLRNPVILPDGQEQGEKNLLSSLTIISGRTAGGKDKESETRKSTLQFRTLPKKTTAALLDQCRKNGVKISNALTAAIALTSTDFIDGGTKKKNVKRNYKVLQSLDMRRLGEHLDKAETVACMAGSMDLMHGPIQDRSGQSLRQNPNKDSMDLFWKLAKEGKQQTEEFFQSKGPVHATRVFDFAMSISDLNNLVFLTAQSKDTKGRAYSAGATNVGVYERDAAFRVEGESDRAQLKTQHGRYKVEDVFFATPHIQSGCLYPVSCLTVGGELKLVSNPVSPIVDEETNRRFADALVDLLTTVATGEATMTTALEEESSRNGGLQSQLLDALPIAVAAFGAAAVAAHGPAWVEFFQSVNEMKNNVDSPADFWAALNFWIFFAVGHPILQPILWISDVLHGSPGPMVGGLVPATFIAGNLLVIGAVAASKQLRNAVNIAAVAALFAYVGAGLDGAAGLGDFNLTLDDSFQGKVVKGCPAYEEVRQPSMDNFILEKYQGKWYEQKFHDWTQFNEVYDTTLSIKLTDDGKGWVDDFAVKGPAPDAAKLSWEKSPVANGAHYFLFGRVDEKDPKGVLRESGFGVEFPNYIVDVKKDPLTGEYTEAIQFQCLERGGVRVFEGINFLSRNPTMTDDEMAAMHARAEKAGMYQYGASPEQMHTVARKLDETPIDNNWQAMWRAIGLDRLLELLTESIEDGGRS